jgi:flavin reductase (DIM6/NTAB) family NADH-FMN oxidoreductase RutF
MAANVSFLTCVGADGRANITTVMLGGWVCRWPHLSGVSLNAGGYSNKCVRETGQFALCVPPAALAKQLNYCGIVSGRDVDKLKVLQLGTTPGAKLGLPIVDGCVEYAECRVKEILHYGSHDFIVGERVGEAASPEFHDSSGKPIVTPRTVPVVSYTGFDFWCLGEKVWDYTRDSQHLLEVINKERQTRPESAR